jgi:hypothetical protein
VFPSQARAVHAMLTDTSSRQVTLLTVRDRFGDLLGDYHCLGKTIFITDLPGEHTLKTKVKVASKATLRESKC